MWANVGRIWDEVALAGDKALAAARECCHLGLSEEGFGIASLDGNAERVRFILCWRIYRC